MKKDFAIKETSVSTSSGAGKDPNACIKVKPPPKPFLASQQPNLPSCPPQGFSTVQDFNLESFIQKRWYIQQQMPTLYLPVGGNRCVYAEYALLAKKSFWGYDVTVHNHAEDTAPHRRSMILVP